jgi:NAD+ diphosphatase
MPSLFDGLPVSEPSAATGFAGNVIDRRSEWRSETAIADALADPKARLYLLQGDRALLKAGPPLSPLHRPEEAAELGAIDEQSVLLGWTPEGPRLAAMLPESITIDPERITAIDLRSLAIQGLLPPDQIGAFAQARSLCNWHARHGYCANCGAVTAAGAGGYRRDCPECGTQHFPRTDPVVIMLSIDASLGRERCLLGRQARFAPGMYSCLAGFLEPGETIENAVRRETQEEAGIRVGRVRYFASQPWPFPSSLMIGCHAEALSTEIRRDEAELEDCRWFEKDEVRAMLAGAHPEGIKAPTGMAIASHIVRAWVERG